jgi:hypothetical protein
MFLQLRAASVRERHVFGSRVIQYVGAFRMQDRGRFPNARPQPTRTIALRPATFGS